MTRCQWAGSDPLYIEYHDGEWGVPQHNDRRLFEKIILEGAQAGLSWITILRKRENYRRLFDNFDAEKIARYDENKVNSLLADPGIIRNKLKINAAIKNARAFLDIAADFGSFDAYIWQFVEGQTVKNAYKSMQEIPTETSESKAMSKALKQRGFTFVGPTICYAYMQSVGMVNDHLIDCFRYDQV